MSLKKMKHVKQIKQMKYVKNETLKLCALKDDFRSFKLFQNLL